MARTRITGIAIAGITAPTLPTIDELLAPTLPTIDVNNDELFMEVPLTVNPTARRAVSLSMNGEDWTIVVEGVVEFDLAATPDRVSLALGSVSVIDIVERDEKGKPIPDTDPLGVQVGFTYSMDPGFRCSGVPRGATAFGAANLEEALEIVTGLAEAIQLQIERDESDEEVEAEVSADTSDPNWLTKTLNGIVATADGGVVIPIAPTNMGGKVRNLSFDTIADFEYFRTWLAAYVPKALAACEDALAKVRASESAE